MNVRWEATNLTTGRGSKLLGFLCVFAAMGGIMAAMPFFMKDGSPQADAPLIRFSLITMGVFGVLAFLVVVRTRVRVRVGWGGDEMCIEIRGARGAATYRGPFELERGLTIQIVPTGHYGRVVTVPTLMLAVRDPSGRVCLLLREQMRAIDEVPSAWPPEPVIVSGCEHEYTNTFGSLRLTDLAFALTPSSRRSP